MRLIDTHAHLYLPEFDADRQAIVESAIAKGVDTIMLPNIDLDSVASLKALHELFPANCLPMMGLHPTSVKDDWDRQLEGISNELAVGKYVAVGEIGIDLYWDQQYREQQINVFTEQLRLAKACQLPVAIHTREAFPLILDIVEREKTDGLKGVFHCFTGTSDDARRIIDLGFIMGIGGVLTYKKSSLPEVVAGFSLDHFVLETDAPFLPPVPFRGQRNQSAYLIYIAQKLAEVCHTDLMTVAQRTTHNACKLFNCA